MLFLRTIILGLVCISAQAAERSALIELPTEDGVIKGLGITKKELYMSKIREWSDTDSQISWKVEFANEGKVGVSITQACPEESAGGSYTVKVGEQVITAEVKGTSSWNTFKRFHLGEFEIKQPGSYTISIKAERIPKETLMHFDKITLTGAAVKGAQCQTYRLAPITRESAVTIAKDKGVPHNTLSEFEKEAGWQLLFDGKTTDGWMGFRTDKIPPKWQAINGELVCVPGQGKSSSLITQKKYADFEFSCEWNIAKDGDSGIFLRFDETKRQPYEQFPEYQLFDNDSIAQGLKPNRAAGAGYDLYPSKIEAYRGAGKWNHTRIRVQQNKVEFFLNNIKTAEFSPGTPSFQSLVASSKFHRWGDFGKLQSGHIGLQDYYSEIKFRNIKILPLNLIIEK